MGKIRLMTGSSIGSEYEIDKPITIGRDPGNVIRLSETEVSRRHASIEPQGARFVVKDLGSRNGVFVNGTRVPEKILANGDEILIGVTKFLFLDSVQASFISKKKTTTHGKILPGVEATLSLADRTMILSEASTSENIDILKSANQKLRVMYEVNNSIGAMLNLHKLLQKILDIVFDNLPADRGFIMLLDEVTRELKSEVVKTRDGDKQQTARVSRTIVNQAIEERIAILSSDAMGDERFQAGVSVMQQGIRSAMCVPLICKEKVLGILQVDTTNMANAFSEDDLVMLTAIAGPAGIAVENARLYEEEKEMFKEMTLALTDAIDKRDPYTRGHSQRVAEFSFAMAQVMGLPEEECEKIRIGALLHDVGKINVLDAILRKPGRLTEDEYRELQHHPLAGAEIVSFVKKFSSMVPGIEEHHEKADGTGYPKGLKGEAISLLGRIVAVADTFDAMTSNRPYRNRLPDDVVLEELKKCAGTQLDPAVVDAFLKAYAEGKIHSTDK